MDILEVPQWKWQILQKIHICCLLVVPPNHDVQIRNFTSVVKKQRMHWRNDHKHMKDLPIINASVSRVKKDYDGFMLTLYGASATS